VPTISEGHTSDLKWDTGRTRVWLSRMTKEDGMPYDNQVIVETRQHAASKGPLWKTTLKYQAKGRPLSQFLLPRLEAEAAYFRAQRMFPGKHVAIGKSEHPGQAMLQSTQLTRNQLLKTLKVQHDSAASLRRAMAKVKKHESGGNPSVRSPSDFKGELARLVEREKEAKRAEAERREGHIARMRREIGDSARRGEQPHLRTPEDIERTAVSFGRAAHFEAERERRAARQYSEADRKLKAKGGARGASAKKHESGNNPRTKKHPLDAAAVQRIERAAARRHVAPSRSAKGSRKRAPFTGAQRKQRGLAPLDAGLKARVDALVGRGKK
jgi:hypothetical protein